MAAVAGSMFFLMVLGFSVWVIAATLRPTLARIAELLQLQAEPPEPARVIVLRPTAEPVPFRQAA